MRRKPYTLHAPCKGKRRFWTVTFRPGNGQRIQRSTGTPHQAAAKEWAILWIREHSPTLRRLLDLRSYRPPRKTRTPRHHQPHLLAA